MGWLAAGDTYEVALVEGRVVARRAAGASPAGQEATQERTLPVELEGRPEVVELQRFADWLDRHAAECAAQVGNWMVSSLPVPTGLLSRLWADEAWQAALRDIVIVGDGDGDGDGPHEVGFLRGVTDSGGVRMVNLEGETVPLGDRSVTMPHPILLPGLEGLRAWAAESGLVQGVEQIHRAIWRKPADSVGAPAAVTEFAGAEYRSWFHLSSRATSLGYRIAGSSVVDRIRDAGRIITASVGMSDPYTEEKAWTGNLTWFDEGGRRLSLDEVGPVAWSEGMRMAAALHAGSAVPKDGVA